MVNVEGQIQGEIPIDQPAATTDKIVERVTEYFDGPATKDVAKDVQIAQISATK